MPATLLAVANLRRHFGGVRAVDGVSLAVTEGGVHGLIGPNGAGKTTLVNLVTGYVRPDGGEVRLGEREITSLPPHAIAAAGVARTFQNLRLYRGLSARENVQVGMHLQRPRDMASQLLVLPRRRAAQRARAVEADRLLALVGLDPAVAGPRAAGTLAYGDQRRLEIARALALGPRLLVLDEPSAGLTAAEKSALADLLRTLVADGLTVLLIDHDMRLVMSLCSHVAVLDFGRRIAEGPPEAVSAQPEVLAAYLGVASSDPPRDAGGGPMPTSTQPPVVAGPEPDPATPRATRKTRAPVPGETAKSGALLAVEDLEVRYGAVQALRGVSLHVGEGEIVALLGANGAGKSTTLHTLSGVVRPSAGRVRFAALDLTTASPAGIVAAGLVQVPERREILARLTVRENLELGGWSRPDRREVAGEVAAMEERFPVLGQRRALPAGQLSGGEQQVLAVARALLARPKLLLLDEPSLGLAPRLVETVFEIVAQIRAEGLAVLLVEQNARRALELADRAYVLETGVVRLSGPAAELRSDPAVERAYLGG